MPNITDNVLFKTIIILIICFGLLYSLFHTIKNLFTVFCGKRKEGLMLERFALPPPPPVTPPEGSVAFTKIKKQYDDLIAKFDKLETNIEKAGSDIGDIDFKYNDLNREICSNLRRVDDGIKGVYCARVPKDEIRLSLKEQEKRAIDRKSNSNIYLGMMKSAYRDSTSKDVMECYQNPPSGTGGTGTDTSAPPPENIITIDEYNAIEKIKSDLSNKIFEINSALAILKNSYSKLRGKITASRITSYKATLDYNNTHMKKLKDAIININEGFTNPKPKPKITANVKLKEEDIYKSMNDDYTAINKDLTDMKKVLNDITKLVTKQTPEIKKIEDTIPKPVAKATSGVASKAASTKPNTPIKPVKK